MKQCTEVFGHVGPWRSVILENTSEKHLPFTYETLELLQLQKPWSPTYLSCLKYQQCDRAICELPCVSSCNCMCLHSTPGASVCVPGRQDCRCKVWMKYGSNLALCPPWPHPFSPPAQSLDAFPGPFGQTKEGVRAGLRGGGWSLYWQGVSQVP